MTGNAENTNSRCFVQFDQYFNRLLCVAHVNKRQGSSETSWWDSKQVLELRDAHMTGWTCGVASDQRLRQVGDHKTKPYHTQNDLQRGGGEAVKIKPFLTGWRSLENHWKTPGWALSGRRGHTLSGLCMRPGQQCLQSLFHWWCSP